MDETGEITILCNNCDRDIPAPNIDLHRVHCPRNLEKCKVCGDMVPKKHAEEHFLNAHASFVMSFVESSSQTSHETTCPGSLLNNVESSRNTRAAQGGGRRRDWNGVSNKRLFFNVAVTGIAVLMGSLFFQRKP